MLMFLLLCLLVYLAHKHIKVGSKGMLTDDGKTILVFDIETSGLSPSENDILQLSYQLYDSSDMAKPLKEADLFFPYPTDERRVSPKAIEVNGLTENVLNEKCNSSREDGLKQFIGIVEKADILVAHNGMFDLKFINHGLDTYKMGEFVLSDKMFDTMKKTVKLCALPRNGGGYKYPKLSELADVLGVNHNDLKLHDSMSDVILTARCYKKLMDGNYKID